MGDLFLTDLGNAERFIEQNGDRVLYCAGRWHAWDGTRWAMNDAEVETLAQASARSWWREAETASRDEQLAIVRHARKSESALAIAAMLRLAQPMKTVAPAKLDADRMKLNTLSGIIDLSTGRLHEHDPAALMTKMAPVQFAGMNATAPAWEKFLARIMDGNEALIGYLQRLCGMWMTGDITVQEFYILWGCGGNGKSVFTDTIMGTMGDYAGSAANSLLTHRGGFGEHPTELADLAGKRLVIGSENEEGAELRVQLVKQITGNATLKARFMRQDYFEFPRTHKLVLVTNNRPLIRETTNAIWRRVRLVPFTVTIPAEEQDVLLVDKLRMEWPGIMAWAVRGCLEWQRHGLQTPSEVTIATGAYQLEQDVLGEYMADRCVRGQDVRVPRNDLYSDYQSYCVTQGDKHPMDRNQFFDRIRRVAGVGEMQTRIGGVPVRIFTGIALSCATAQQGATGDFV